MAQGNNEVKAQVIGLGRQQRLLEVLTFGLVDFVTTASAYVICLTSGDSRGGQASVAPQRGGQWAAPVGSAGATTLKGNLARPQRPELVASILPNSRLG